MGLMDGTRANGFVRPDAVRPDSAFPDWAVGVATVAGVTGVVSVAGAAAASGLIEGTRANGLGRPLAVRCAVAAGVDASVVPLAPARGAGTAKPPGVGAGLPLMAKAA